MIKVNLRNWPIVNRVGLLLHHSRGKRVLHLGATDAPETDSAIDADRFLHNHLKKEAAHLLGMDNNLEIIDRLRKTYGIDDILYGDIECAADYPSETFDVIVAGEVLEHLSNPGRALDALRARMGLGAELILTVPNAYSLKSFLRAVAGHELIHPDHVLHHSLGTLVALLERHGFTVMQMFSYVNGGTGWLANITNQLLKIFPQLAEGVGAVCVRKEY